MEYMATVDVETSQNDEDILDQLDAYHPAIGASKNGYRIVYTYDSDTLDQAYTKAKQIATSVGTPYAIAIAPAELEDEDTKSGPMPPLLSVEETAKMLKISPQAVKKRIKKGTLSGTKVGKIWVVPLHAAMSALIH